MRHGRVLGALVLMLAVSAAAVSGQTVSATTGAINGRVVDVSGGVLPGATVTISSPAMQGTQTDVTNTEGNYRFPALPPGEYKIVFELPGFTTLVREGIRVTLGFTATVNVELRVAGLEETVTVKGESPVVDVQSTRTTTSFDSRLLASLPNARDMWAVLAEAPAVQVVRIDVGGSTAGTQTGYNAYDAQGGQNRVMIDGMVTTEGSSAIGVYVDYGSFDEISVGMAGHSAEMGWPGFQTQMIAKSGGNEYHGSIYADYQNESIQAHNVDAEQIARGAESREANRMHAYRDFNADAGGFISKDKIWWYGSYRTFNVEARYANFPVKPHQTALQHYTGKATFSLPRNNKLIVFQTATRKFQPTRLDAWRIGNAINRTVESTESQEHWAWVGKVEWNKVLGDALFFEIRGGQFGYNWPLKPQPGAKLPRVEDIGNNLVSGNNRDWLQSRRRNQVLGSLSYFKDDWGGDHNFKFGGEIFHETWLEEWYEGAYFNGVISYLRNGAPVEVDLFEFPGRSVGGLMTYSAYANDIWRMSRRLTLTLGLRFDRYRNYLPEQEHPAGPFSPVATKFPAVDELTNWNLFAPRLGATYDVQGNGKTVVKFNYGQYWWNPSVLTGPNPNSSPWYKRYTWSDLNGNSVWDRGEEGRLISTQGGAAAESINPELENTFTREVSAWVERELMPNFGIRTGLVFRGIQQQYGRYNARQPFAAFNVPVQIQDPGPDGVTGTSDDGPAIAPTSTRASSACRR